MTHNLWLIKQYSMAIKSLWSEMEHRLTEQNFILNISDEPRNHLEFLFSQLVTTFEWQRINSSSSFICKQNDFSHWFNLFPKNEENSPKKRLTIGHSDDLSEWTRPWEPMNETENIIWCLQDLWFCLKGFEEIFLREYQ